MTVTIYDVEGKHVFQWPLYHVLLMGTRMLKQRQK